MLAGPQIDTFSKTHTRKVVILGQGYVGLPVAMRAVEVGHVVTGFDVDIQKVDQLRRGHSPIDDVTDTEVAAALQSGRYRATDDVDDIAGFDVAIISVPTPLRERIPDLSYVEYAADLVARHLKPGNCVILESTTYPGTTQDIVVPRLEAYGLRAGTDFHVGYSPERIDPGNQTWSFVTTPKLTSGISKRCAEVVDDFYTTLVDTTVPVPTVRAAEMAKLLENTFRHVNIALVNELAMYAHELNIDVWSVVDAAASKPFGFMAFRPGPGVGGHCLPIDPSYLSWQVKNSLGRAFRFVELANDVNDHMPEYVVRRSIEHLNNRRLSVNGSRILLVGLAYKPDTGDARQAPAGEIVEGLVRLGATVAAADPHVDLRYVPKHVHHVAFCEEEVALADLIIVVTNHSCFDWTVLSDHCARVLDTRNCLPVGCAAERL